MCQIVFILKIDFMLIKLNGLNLKSYRYHVEPVPYVSILGPLLFILYIIIVIVCNYQVCILTVFMVATDTNVSPTPDLKYINWYLGR
jgi:hypothetical protein